VYAEDELAFGLEEARSKVEELGAIWSLLPAAVALVFFARQNPWF
jgi:hypothetical protein